MTAVAAEARPRRRPRGEVHAEKVERVEEYLFFWRVLRWPRSRVAARLGVSLRCLDRYDEWLATLTGEEREAVTPCWLAVPAGPGRR